MLNDNKNHNLTDLIDLDFLQKFQDSFSAATGFASVTVDTKGPVTTPSNFTNFCEKFTRKSELGGKRCNQSDMSAGKIAAEKGEPVIYKCHAGLTDFAVPIMLDGEHIGSILGGQTLSNPPNKEYYNKLADLFGLDKEEYFKAAQDLKQIPKENVKAAADLLSLVANSLSEIALKNYKLIKKNEEQELYKKITEAIRNTLDIAVVKTSIVNTIGETMQADRCFIIDYDEKENKFLPIKSEYLSSPEVLSVRGFVPERDIPNYVEILKKGEALLINNKKFYIDDKKRNYAKEIEVIEKYEVYSSYAMPLFYNDEFLGSLTIQYVKEHIITLEEINLIKLVGAQIAIALHQANLFQKLSQISENQKAILNNMPFMAWLKDLDSNYVAVNNVFAEGFGISPELMIGKNDFEFFPEVHAKSYRAADITVIEGKKTIQFEEPIKIHGEERYHMTFKSPVYDSNRNVVGTVGMSRDVTEEKEAQMELLARQEKIVKAREREKLYINILEKIRTTLDFHELKKIIVEIVGKTFDADRCIIIEYDAENQKYFDVENEYLSSPDIRSYVGIDVNMLYPGFNQAIQKGKAVIIDAGEISIENETQNSFVKDKESLKSYKVHSAFALPLFYYNDFLGILVVQYVKKDYIINDEDLSLGSIIAGQVAIAIYQSSLYKITQMQAERERINRALVEILRSTLDKPTIKKLFVDNFGKYFKANRVLISEYDHKTNKFLPIDEEAEYLSSNQEKSFVGYDWSKTEADEFVELLLNKREINIYDWNEYIKEHERSNDFKNLFQNSGVKSSYNIPIFYQEKLMGFFCIEFTRKVVRLSNEDINRIRNISAQAGIALYQAELFRKAQESSVSKGDFIADISTELQTPLDDIMEFSDIVKKQELNCESKLEYADKIIRRGHEIYDLKNNILILSQIEEEDFTLSYEQVDLNNIFYELKGSLEQFTSNRNININIYSEVYNLNADKNRLRQLLYNILKSVLKLVISDLNIDLISKYEEDKPVIQINLTGDNLDIEIKNRIFSTLKEIDTYYPRKRKGIGLGLSLSEKLVKLHNALILVESITNSDTSLKIIFPSN